jgi:hypothetical protein
LSHRINNIIPAGIMIPSKPKPIAFSYFGKEDESHDKANEAALFIKWIYYSNNFNLKDKINRNGYNCEELTEEALDYFINKLNENIKLDYKLDEILATKEHINQTEEIFDMVKRISQEPKKEKTKWRMTDKSGNIVPLKEGEKYIIDNKNGRSIIMIKDESIFVEIQTLDNKSSYYEFDSDGNAKNNIKGYLPLNEYTIDIPPSHILSKDVFQ